MIRWIRPSVRRSFGDRPRKGHRGLVVDDVPRHIDEIFESLHLGPSGNRGAARLRELCLASVERSD